MTRGKPSPPQPFWLRSSRRRVCKLCIRIENYTFVTTCICLFCVIPDVILTVSRYDVVNLSLFPIRLAPYRGWFPLICSLCCSNFVYFYCFHSLKATWLRGHRSTPGRDLIVGIVAGLLIYLYNMLPVRSKIKRLKISVVVDFGHFFTV